MTVLYAILLVTLPSAAGLGGLLTRNSRRRFATALGIGTSVVTLGNAIALAIVVGTGTVDRSRGWVRFGSLDVTVGIRLDRGLAYVAIAVAVVALAVQVYSVAYLAHDDRYPPYAAQITLFTAAMLLVIVAGDLILLLVGWEVMGICSYLLIAHERVLPAAPPAAVKAFLVTRFGDAGFLLGIALLAVRVGTSRIGPIEGARLSPRLLTVACLLLLLGALGKSAQFPLHTWLADAMAGPTPTSALIHAATMVAAGVVVLVKFQPLFAAAPDLPAVIGIGAAITMLLGALAAMATDDIKRVLAWSTVSQVAYMFGSFAVGLRSPALFHLLTHAAFKALLFLGAGCVIHALGTTLVSDMGGLRKRMPVTFVSMTVGLAALAGVPPFSGFFSKDAIMSTAWNSVVAGGAAPKWVDVTVLGAMLATAALTAWYATRLWLAMFFGAYRGDGNPHDPPPLMRWPVLVLTIPAALLGFAGLSSAVTRVLGGPGSTIAAYGPWNRATIASVVLVAVGIGSAWDAWRRQGVADRIFANAFYLDHAQDIAVVRPVHAVASAVMRADASVIDGTIERAGRQTFQIGGWFATWHRGPMPRASTAVLGGSIVIAIAAVILGGI